jgi:hypothetical protein
MHIIRRIHFLEVFIGLKESNLKLKLVKCHFGFRNVDYLEFSLTPSSILPSTDRLKCVRKASPPRNVLEIRRILGLASFFNSYVINFAFVSSSLK